MGVHLTPTYPMYRFFYTLQRYIVYRYLLVDVSIHIDVLLQLKPLSASTSSSSSSSSRADLWAEGGVFSSERWKSPISHIKATRTAASHHIQARSCA